MITSTVRCEDIMTTNQTSRRNLYATGALAFSLLAAACGADDGVNAASASGNNNVNAQVETVTVDDLDIQLTSGLATFDTCSALLTHLQTEGAERVGAFGFNNGGGFFGFDDGLVEEAMEDEEAAFDSAESSVDTATSAQRTGGESALVEGEDFSGTNNQEQGVDEPDFVKTDGERIFTLTNGNFTIVEADADNPVVRGSTFVNYEIQEMLILGDRVYLFGTGYGERFFDERSFDGDAESEFAGGIIEDEAFFGPTVQVIELDVSDLDNPQEVGTLDIEGRYLSARLIDGQISLALQSDQHDLGFVFPQGRNGEDRAAEFNREVVRDTEISDWLPNYTLTRNGDTSSGQLSSCEQVHAPTEFAGFGSLSVITFDGSDGLDTPDAVSVLAEGQNVYASSTNMWISTTQWFDWGAMTDEARNLADENFTSQLHGFSISGESPEYVASGSVRGHLLNQFAMSEHDGVLRVATTDGSIWTGNQDSESFVTTFEIDGNELRQLGEVGDMGRGEQIFAVRFVADTAYVVTFRQTDPFYTVDLSDPANPVVLGELKITGFSGQLHPVGPEHVIGIGQEATEEGRQTGAKVTLFDVSDLSNPVDVANWIAEDAWSDAQWDHRAFLWWPQEDLAVLPVQNYRDGFYGAVAFRVDTDAGTLTEAARIAHEPEEGQEIGRTECEVLDPTFFEQFEGRQDEFGELFYIGMEFSGGNGQAQLCGDNESGATGLFCDRWDWVDTDGLGLEGTLEVCWPEQGPDPIVRTMVIGDTLWSLSWARVQANDLATFNAGEFVELSQANR